MAVPRKKTSKSKQRQRRSHHKLETAAFVEDKESGELRRPHHIDLSSGRYRGREILKKA